MFVHIFFSYICPSLGVVMSTLMYAAPVNDLRAALNKGKLGKLNPIPWAVMMGNCVVSGYDVVMRVQMGGIALITVSFFVCSLLQGWIAYAYYVRDPYILASSIPGVLVSTWLNLGASKLQYFGLRETVNLGDTPAESHRFVLVPQELLLLRILFLWLVILVSVGWLGVTNGHEVATIGVLVNINLLFFYGAPLQTIKTVIAEGSSESIHRPLMRMNWLNTSFWVLYGYGARHDTVIYGPNAVGLLFGIIQGVLCCIYPAKVDVDIDSEPLLVDEDVDSTAEPLPPSREVV
jgi:solute carrier family 50 protein (sugar transporter)